MYHGGYQIHRAIGDQEYRSRLLGGRLGREFGMKSGMVVQTLLNQLSQLDAEHMRFVNRSSWLIIANRWVLSKGNTNGYNLWALADLCR